MKTDADTDRLIQAAMECARHGWRVLPIKPSSKLPLIKAWQQAATADEATIAEWWEKWPTANVGVCLGEGSGILDLECDSEKAEQEFLALFDGEPPVTTTYQGQRGKHRLFRWRNDLPGGAVIKLGNIEVRTGNSGKGAQSVFPPSIHPSGIAYQWLVPPGECTPAALPDAILARLWNLAGDDLSPPIGGGMEHTAAERAALYVDAIEGCAAGGRNQRGYKVACVLLRDFALSMTDAWPILVGWNGRNAPPLGEVELRHCATSAEKYGLGVVGNKLDGAAPAKPRRVKQWEPIKTPPANTVVTDDFSFLDNMGPPPDMSECCSVLIANWKTLSKTSDVMAAYKAVEAQNYQREKPLSENELKAVFTAHLKTERSRRMAHQAEAVLSPSPEGIVDKAAKAVKGQPHVGVWRLTIIHSDPPRYELYSPLFRKTPFIVLNSKQMNSPSAIRIEALDQAECAMPKAFDKLWSDPGGLYESVIHTAEHRSAPLEEQRHLVVADCLREKLGKARIIEEGKEPDPRGRPCLMPDGSIVFKFNAVWEELWQGAHRIEKGELSKVLQNLGATWRWFGNSRLEKRPRFKCIPREGMETLAKMLDSDGDGNSE
jgi:hypothetical protein